MLNWLIRRPCWTWLDSTEQVCIWWTCVRLINNRFQQMFDLYLSLCPAAGLMHTFNAHAATDITGFGILGHAQNLARQQRTEVSFVIHNLPVLAKMAAVSKACGNMFGLMHGTCPETSGKDQTFVAPLKSLFIYVMSFIHHDENWKLK